MYLLTSTFHNIINYYEFSYIESTKIGGLEHFRGTLTITGGSFKYQLIHILYKSWRSMIWQQLSYSWRYGEKGQHLQRDSSEGLRKLIWALQSQPQN